jgi:leucine-zipper-like transcriptional regulator 1
LNDLWKYDIETKHWTCIQESSGPAAVRGDSNEQLNDNGEQRNVNQNNNNANVAPVVQGKVPTRRFGYVSVVHDGKFVLFGGFDVRYVGWCCTSP